MVWVDTRALAGLASEYRAKWSARGERERAYKGCLADFASDAEIPFRDVFCLCLAEGMQAPDAHWFATGQRCRLMLSPVLTRTFGVDECESTYSGETCACLVGTRAQSSRAYLRASEACLALDE